MSVQRLVRNGLPALAYAKSEGTIKSPGILYVGGFMSQKHGSKPTALREYFAPKGYTFISFDYTDKADSVDPKIPKIWSFKQWRDDAITVIDKLTTGPQILVGSSMGAWIALLAAVERPDRVSALVTISASVGFMDSFYKMIPKELYPSYDSGEVIEVHNEYGPIPMSKRMVEEGKQMDLFAEGRHPVEVNCPVRCLHGIADDVADYKESLTFAERIASADVDVILRKSSDHFFKTDADLHLLYETVEKMIKIAK